VQGLVLRLPSETRDGAIVAAAVKAAADSKVVVEIDLLVFAEPSELKKKGNRASRVGPLAVINDGVVSLGATPLPANANWGLVAGPLPPIAGCAWQETHETELKRGPKPLLAPLDTDSTS
jgi:hypothetical protein